MPETASELMIRPGRDEDVPAVRALLVETWHAAYDAIYGVDEVTAITDAWHAEPVLRVQVADPACCFLLAEIDGALVGHALAQSETDGAQRLARLYVAPDRQGCGVGARLLGATLAAGPADASWRLTVEKANPRAIAFYLRHGFVEAARQVEEGRTLIVMSRRA